MLFGMMGPERRARAIRPLVLLLAALNVVALIVLLTQGGA